MTIILFGWKNLCLNLILNLLKSRSNRWILKLSSLPTGSALWHQLKEIKRIKRHKYFKVHSKCSIGYLIRSKITLNTLHLLEFSLILVWNKDIGKVSANLQEPYILKCKLTLKSWLKLKESLITYLNFKKFLKMQKSNLVLKKLSKKWTMIGNMLKYN